MPSQDYRLGIVKAAEVAKQRAAACAAQSKALEDSNPERSARLASAASFLRVLAADLNKMAADDICAPPNQPEVHGVPADPSA